VESEPPIKILNSAGLLRLLSEINKLSRRIFFVRGKISNPPKRPAYLKNSWLRVNFKAREKFLKQSLMFEQKIFLDKLFSSFKIMQAIKDVIIKL